MFKISITVLLICVFLNAFSQQISHPQVYVAYKTIDSIKIDGLDSEKSWKLAERTRHFVDIEGNIKPQPYYNTYVKMLWDKDYLYFFAELKEEHIWATLTKRESIIFYDNDFEIFIDPDGDNHNYYEFEFNALSTEWDLLLTEPYRDGGLPLFSWTSSGIKSAVNINGSINNPNDIDSSWTIEIAIPLNSLKDALKPRKIPEDGDIYRLNFSRVQWETKIENGKYLKLDKDENNWVWSPQYAINMHRPEYWGYLVFRNVKVNNKTQINYTDKDFKIKMILMQIYYAQKQYYKINNEFAKSINKLNIDADTENIKLNCNGNQFIATYKKWNVNHKSKLWEE